METEELVKLQKKLQEQHNRELLSEVNPHRVKLAIIEKKCADIQAQRKAKKLAAEAPERANCNLTSSTSKKQSEIGGGESSQTCASGTWDHTDQRKLKINGSRHFSISRRRDASVEPNSFARPHRALGIILVCSGGQWE